jgi:hypothetical protein
VQWQQSVGGGSFTSIPGATRHKLLLIATQAMNGNQYRAVFTNAFGTVDTSPAALTVDYGP